MLPILLFCGCGTVMNYRYEGPTPYGGVRSDAAAISGLCSGRHLETRSELGFWVQMYGIASIFDLPFSAVADTVILPVTVYKSIERRNAAPPKLGYDEAQAPKLP